MSHEAKAAMGVRVPPGVTWFTRIPRGARSVAKFRVIARTPALVAAYAIEQPDDVDVSEVVVRPTASPF